MRIVSTLLLVLASACLAPALIAKGRPSVGDKAADFALPSLTGDEVRLSDLVGGGPVVLVVLRGYPGYQCPACNRQVHDFLGKVESFADAGAQVVLVYPGPEQDLVERAREFAADKQFPENFRLLLDAGYEFTNLYGLRWDAPRETAYPATFLINEEGVIFFAKISETHGGRTKGIEVIKALNRWRTSR